MTTAIGRLLGLSCGACGRRSYPRRTRCPLCASESTTAVELPESGTVEACTAIGELAIAEIRLDDGTLVLGRVQGRVRPGAGVRIAAAAEVIEFAPG